MSPSKPAMVKLRLTNDPTDTIFIERSILQRNSTYFNRALSRRWWPRPVNVNDDISSLRLEIDLRFRRQNLSECFALTFNPTLDTFWVLQLEGNGGLRHAEITPDMLHAETAVPDVEFVWPAYTETLPTRTDASWMDLQSSLEAATFAHEVILRTIGLPTLTIGPRDETQLLTVRRGPAPFSLLIHDISQVAEIFHYSLFYDVIHLLRDTLCDALRRLRHQYHFREDVKNSPGFYAALATYLGDRCILKMALKCIIGPFMPTWFVAPDIDSFDQTVLPQQVIPIICGTRIYSLQNITGSDNLLEVACIFCGELGCRSWRKSPPGYRPLPLAIGAPSYARALLATAYDIWLARWTSDDRQSAMIIRLYDHGTRSFVNTCFTGQTAFIRLIHLSRTLDLSLLGLHFKRAIQSLSERDHHFASTVILEVLSQLKMIENQAYILFPHAVEKGLLEPNKEFEFEKDQLLFPPAGPFDRWGGRPPKPRGGKGQYQPLTTNRVISEREKIPVLEIINVDEDQGLDCAREMLGGAAETKMMLEAFEANGRPHHETVRRVMEKLERCGKVLKEEAKRLIEQYEVDCKWPEVVVRELVKQSKHETWTAGEGPSMAGTDQYFDF